MKLIRLLTGSQRKLERSGDAGIDSSGESVLDHLKLLLLLLKLLG